MLNGFLLTLLKVCLLLLPVHRILELVSHGWQSQDGEKQLTVQLFSLIQCLVLLKQLVHDLDL